MNLPPILRPWPVSLDEAVMRDGSDAHYLDSFQLLAGYFVQQRWIAPQTKPVITSKYCSLNTKFRAREATPCYTSPSVRHIKSRNWAFAQTEFFCLEPAVRHSFLEDWTALFTGDLLHQECYY